MTIETDFNLKDTVYLLLDNKVVECKISRINVNVEKSYHSDCEITILYETTKTTNLYKKKDLFRTKEELLKSL